MPPVSGTVVEQATLKYVEIQAGSGPAAGAGQQYSVHYTGWLRDGTQFDSSIGKEPLAFVQGRREVIPGFEAGFEGMKVGGKRRLFIPYQLAYGDKPRGKIPPKSDLIFDIELVGVKDVAALQPAADLLLPFRGLREHAVALAKAIPEEKYGWRPGKGVRSIQEVIMHIALGNQLLLNIAMNNPSRDALNKQIEDNAKAESATRSKAEIVRILDDSFAAIQKELEAARNAGLNRPIDFFGAATTRRGIFASTDAHIAEHVGQLIAYARMNSITPPWSAAGN